MKTLKFFAAAAIVMMTVACATNGNEATASETGDSVKSAKVSEPSKALRDSISYYLGVNYGQMLKQYDFGNIDYNLMIKGMKDFVNAKGNQQDEDFVNQFKYNPEDMNEAINKYLMERQEYIAAQNTIKEQKFFADNAKKAGVVETESGLQYIIVEPGNENHPGPMDTVNVLYKGTLLDGTVFDETKTDPVELQLNRVIAAWTEGLQLIGEGGKITLFVPSELGYGSRGAGMIPANSTLIFDVTLESVTPYETEESAE